MQLQPGTYLHKNCFKIISFIGKGGFGITYLAEEAGYLKATGFGEQYVANKQPCKVVIKELYFDDFCNRDTKTNLVYVTNPSKKLEFEKLVNKQLEEGKTLKKLSHKNIVNILDIFKENDTAYMVMDYIESDTLENIVMQSRPAKETALHYIYQVLQAVMYIHDKKILHLDITPSNILIKKGTQDAILIDFGASLTYRGDNHVAAETSKIVTGAKRHFAPIEQSDIDNLKEFDPTFDTYAVAATLYFLLTGAPPPAPGLIVAGKQKLLPPSAINPDAGISDYLDCVILKALNPLYFNRYKSAESIFEAFKQEAVFVEEMGKIDILMIERMYGQALALINETETAFGQLPSMLAVKEKCLKAVEDENRQNEFEVCWNAAKKYYSQQKYTEALNKLATALALAGDQKAQENKVKSQIKKISDERDKQEVKDLLSKAKREINEGNYSQARTLLNEYNNSHQSKPDVLSLLKEIDKKEISLARYTGEKTTVIESKSHVDNNIENEQVIKPVIRDEVVNELQKIKKYKSKKAIWIYPSCGALIVLALAFFLWLKNNTASEDKREPVVVADTVDTVAKPTALTTAEILREIDAGMVLIPKGSFVMGYNGEKNDERPQHIVTIDSFYMSKFELTQKLWKAVTGNNPSINAGCLDCPVENVSWYAAQDFLTKLNKLSGKKYMLPTEAQWEFACCDSTSKNGDKTPSKINTYFFAWYAPYSGNKTHPVGQKLPNKYGLYDMMGNVWEWCSDFYTPDYYKLSPVLNPSGPAESTGSNVVRGGSCGSKKQKFTDRGYNSPGASSRYGGFRLVQTLY